MAEAQPRKKIGAGDHDLGSGARDRIEISILDVLAMAEIVANHECRTLLATARGVDRCGWTAPALVELRPHHQRPQLRHHPIDVLEPRTLDAHRILEARRSLQ